MSYVAPKSWEIPLVSKYLQLEEDERAFFKAMTKINDDAELERHILDVQAQAYQVCDTSFPVRKSFLGASIVHLCVPQSLL